MTIQDLAKIQRVDLREAWPNEAQNFTSWLAENLAELGEALGMDMEIQQTEAPVGGYSLDILASDLNSNRPVIIENQLEATDHTHLGQLLTYAAGFDAGVIVWVTRELRDEHRQALDWLNQHRTEDTQFFGEAVELWGIGDSPPAPHFRLAVTPNGWRRQAAAAAQTRTPSSPSERSERYRNFFQPLFDTLREEHKFTNARMAQAQSWYNFSTGYGQKVTYSANFGCQKRARVEVYIADGDGDWNTWLLESLEAHKEEIEPSLGHPLDWQRLEGRRACRVVFERPGSIDDDAETLAEIRSRMVENLLNFKRVFGPRLAELV